MKGTSAHVLAPVVELVGCQSHALLPLCLLFLPPHAITQSVQDLDTSAAALAVDNPRNGRDWLILSFHEPHPSYVAECNVTCCQKKRTADGNINSYQGVWLPKKVFTSLCYI